MFEADLPSSKEDVTILRKIAHLDLYGWVGRRQGVNHAALWVGAA